MCSESVRSGVLHPSSREKAGPRNSRMEHAPANAVVVERGVSLALQRDGQRAVGATNDLAVPREVHTERQST